jgi:hypothetical protein
VVKIDFETVYVADLAKTWGYDRTVIKAAMYTSTVCSHMPIGRFVFSVFRCNLYERVVLGPLGADNSTSPLNVIINYNI